jgi:hypothetical protein
MASHDPRAVVDHVVLIASYDSLRDVTGQLAGLLLARERAAGAPAEAEPWQQERRALLARLDQFRPGTPQVAEALQHASDRLAALRQPAVSTPGPEN